MISDINQGKLEFLKFFWNNTQDNMFIATLDECNNFFIEDINPSQAKNFGLEMHQLKNKTIKDLFGNEVANKFEEKYYKCLSENIPVIVDEKVEISGKIRYWNTIVIPMHDKETGTQRVFGIAREITEIINTKNELENLNKKLEETVTIRTRELEDANKELLKLALIDHLTGLQNRRYFYEHANRFLTLAKRLKTPVSLIYIDLDYFKQINDTYGHTCGDQVLKKFASILKQINRESDIVSRFGGEEFVLLLNSTSTQNAIKIAKRIQETIKNHNFIFEENKINITISIGIASYTEDYQDIDKLISLADKALYSAKNKGRNRIEISKN